MMLPFTASTPAALDRIGFVERTLGFALPKEYIRFLLTSNGGDVRGFGCEIMHPDHGKIGIPLERFFSVDASNADFDLISNYNYYTGSQRIPSWFLPVAVDVGTNMIGLDVGPGAEGPVYFWDHERELLDENGVFEVAGSLTRFLQAVQKMP
ncbi:SMI1/KNR4 family protein [Variovorax sp. TBS-050B]|uniref:SMI1/KNR4 family protein n=1 Tax=Variovorax sp. TBS-050B TaxID=2940551 RepID=UPI0024747709|nr:SMI1/KNR4 family protein [Variovorax sp. TBS-050B]